MIETEIAVARFTDRFTQNGTNEGVINCFTNGCCFWFASCLFERFINSDPDIVYDVVANHFGCLIEGRVYDITAVDYERVRSTVPIVVNGEVVGILYGIIKLENLERRYLNIATELDAQFFLYDNITGNLLLVDINTVLQYSLSKAM